MSVREPISTPDAPAAIGPYSQAVLYGDLLYCSGQIPLDAASGELLSGTLGEETTRCLENLEAICSAAGTSLARALRMTVYTTNLEAFAEINEAYAVFFPAEPPARSAVGVAALPKGARVEVDAIVAIE